MADHDIADPFGWAVTWLLSPQIEGGYVNDPDDHGGATNRGITQATFNRWRKAQGKPIAPVRELGLSETRDIYRALYWDAVNGDGLAGVSPRMALCVFDAAVQSGPETGVKTLQRALEMQPESIDGIVGPVTLATFRIRRMDQGLPALLERFLDRRRRFYAAIVHHDPSQAKFAKGWRNRRNALRAMVGLEPEDA